MFSYIDSARATEGGVKDESIILPSGLIARYVGIAGYIAGCSNCRALVNLLSTAPGKRTPADPGFWDSDEDHLWARRALWAGYPWRNAELQGLCARRAKGTLIILLLGFIVALRSTRR